MKNRAQLITDACEAVIDAARDDDAKLIIRIIVGLADDVERLIRSEHRGLLFDLANRIANGDENGENQP